MGVSRVGTVESSVPATFSDRAPGVVDLNFNYPLLVVSQMDGSDWPVKFGSSNGVVVVGYAGLGSPTSLGSISLYSYNIEFSTCVLRCDSLMGGYSDTPVLYVDVADLSQSFGSFPNSTWRSVFYFQPTPVSV
jgi:hypothetical protein